MTCQLTLSTKGAKEKSYDEKPPMETVEPPVNADTAGSSGYPVAPAGGVEWFSSLSSKPLSDSNNFQL